MKIYIGFSRPKKKFFPIISWLIRWLDQVPFSHVYFRWECQTGVECFYHAASDMVHFLGGSIARESLEIVEEYSLEVNESQLALFDKMTKKRAGTPYAKLQLVGMMFVRLFKLKTNPWSDGTSTVVCSEEVTHMLRNVFDKEVPGDVEIEGLRHLRDWCQKHLRKLNG